jgi:hypothetical protein
MKVNNIYKGIYEIENFLSKEENNEVLIFINSLTEDDWNAESPFDEGWWKTKLLRLFDNKMLINISNKISNLFLSKQDMVPINKIQRFNDGQGMGIHKDHCLDDDNVEYGIVVYFNDNYEGGEIEYPDLKITIKPKSGSLIIHHGEINHKVNNVIGNVSRYFTTTFIRGTKEIPAILNPEFFNNEEMVD